MTKANDYIFDIAERKRINLKIYQDIMQSKQKNKNNEKVSNASEKCGIPSSTTLYICQKEKRMIRRKEREKRMKKMLTM